jgi:CubicO group peptidase (beta-lactamase class C family)
VEHVRAEVAEHGEAFGVPGYVAGVYHDGEQVLSAHGTANLATGVPMREDTGYLVGSITKVLTTALMLRYA